MHPKTIGKWLLWGTLLGIAAPLQAQELPAKADAALDLSNMDLSVDPGQDFFLYVNGGWAKRSQIPSDRGRWGSFDELREANEQRMLRILQQAGTPAAGSDERKAVDFFRSGMDSARIEALGYKPLRPWLKTIGKVRDLKDFQRVVGQLHAQQMPALFSVFAMQDMKQSERMALYLSHAGLGLPNKDYYTKQDEKSVQTRKEYEQHMARMFALIGVKEAKAAQKAQQVMALEQRLAAGFRTPVEMRDPTKAYNPYALSQLQAEVSGWDWQAYLQGMGVQADTLVVRQPEYFKALGGVLAGTPIETLRDYLTWSLLRSSAPYLSTAFVQEQFSFYGQRLQGLKANSERSKRVLGVSSSAVGFAMGKLYVKEAFPPRAKQMAQEMVADIVAAYEQRIGQLAWMSPQTKQQAIGKLKGMTVKIGYPDKWETYEDLQVSERDYFGNVLSSNRRQRQRNLSKLGKPVDRSEWGMTPQTVNAYYSPLFNEIVFPAAILQPPFFNYQADAAVNYGGIGAVIGHEISHGFDDSGSRFDAKGELKNWWTEQDLQAFKGRAQVLVEQFSGYEPLPGLHVNGELTLGENIADLGGVASAYDGLQRAMARGGRPAPISGFGPEQRFFISWATIWRTLSRPEALRTQVLTDPHSPGQYRANGPLSNFPAFYEAFGIKAEAPMHRPEEKRASIW